MKIPAKKKTEYSQKLVTMGIEKSKMLTVIFKIKVIINIAAVGIL